MKRKKVEQQLGRIKKGKIITLDFKLEPRTTFLKEVVVQENRKPIRIKNDTIVYDPEKFKDGSEKVVEDLLKKLPGIKIEENGEIKFNGKSIKKMLLDGDDLFDSQYTVGSKNINVEMLDKVEAIEIDLFDKQILFHLSKGTKTNEITQYIPISLEAVEKRKLNLKKLLDLIDESDIELVREAKNRGLLF